MLAKWNGTFADWFKIKFQDHISDSNVKCIAQGTALNYFALARIFDIQWGRRENLVVYNAMTWVYTIQKSFKEISERRRVSGKVIIFLLFFKVWRYFL